MDLPGTVTLLNLHLLVPWRGVRQIIYCKLTDLDLKMVWLAHNRCKEASFATDDEFESEWMMIRFALEGHTALLQWGRERGCRVWDEELCRAAALKGRFETLRWLREVGTAWGPEVFCAAGEGGYVNILAWALANGCPRGSDYDPVIFAAYGGKLPAVQWLVENGFKWCKDAMYRAAQRGHLHMLEWSWAQGHVLDARAQRAAIEGGSVQVLHRWVELGHPLSLCGSLCDGAASIGLVVLQWVRGQGCPWGDYVLSSAARYGQVDALKWAYENGCPWGDGTMEAAMQNGDVKMIEWLRENGCPWDWDNAVRNANNAAQVLDWIKANKPFMS
jgi:hypothetical protein